MTEVERDLGMTSEFTPVRESKSRKHLLVNTLHYFHGDKTKAAKSLGVNLRTIYNWLHEFGLSNEWRIYK